MGTLHYYHADGSYDTRRAADCPPLEDLQSFVGGYVECVWVLFNEKRCAMFVNEDGHRLNLPVNLQATKIYHEAALRKGRINPNPILGNAMVLEDIVVE